MDVGFIGLGRMGRAMTSNLLKHGHRVYAWDRLPGALSSLADGTIIARDAREAVRHDAIISMLPDDHAVREVFNGELLQSMDRNAVHANMATVSIVCADELASLHTQYGVRYISAPVFGRPEVAAQGALHIVASGNADAVAFCQPLFDAMGCKTWRVGGQPRHANLTKIAGNLMVLSVVEALAEAATLARAHDVGAAELMNVIVAAMFDVPVYRGYSAMIASLDYAPVGSTLQLGLKDIKLALAAAEAVNVSLPFASVLRDHLIESIADSDTPRDWGALAAVAARKAGLSG